MRNNMLDIIPPIFAFKYGDDKRFFSLIDSAHKTGPGRVGVTGFPVDFISPVIKQDLIMTFEADLTAVL